MRFELKLALDYIPASCVALRNHTGKWLPESKYGLSQCKKAKDTASELVVGFIGSQIERNRFQRVSKAKERYEQPAPEILLLLISPGFCSRSIASALFREGRTHDGRVCRGHD